MNKFIIKFCIILTIFFIPAAIFHFYAQRNLSGDLGRLGMIPFGKEHEGLNTSWYCRNYDDAAQIIDIYNPDSLRLFSTISIGDSFSQCNINGYQFSLSQCLGCPIANFKCFPSYDIYDNYLILLNNGYITTGQTVILESVERYFISRCYRINPLEFCDPIPPSRNIHNDEEQPQTTFLNSYFSWLRLSAGYKNPIYCFSLNKDCFTHKKYSRTLFVYNSTKLGDGDLSWDRINDEQYQIAGQNIMNMIELSEHKGINLIIMVACDKYDAYEPWIKENHSENPTFNHIPKNKRIYISRPCLRNAIDKGIKDVYKVNDTHWSVVGADIVGNDLYKWMKASDLLLQQSREDDYKIIPPH